MSFIQRSRAIAAIAVFALFTVACVGSSGDSDSSGGSGTESSSTAPATQPPATTATPVTSTSTTAAPTTTAPPASTTTSPLVSTTVTSTEPPAAPPLDTSGDAVTVNWESLPSEPFFAPAGGGADPLYHIHTNPEVDGFFLSFEMYTTGYGEQWTGETGTFDISCADPVASTGICPYFDPDGSGPLVPLGSDFAAVGSVTITQLDGDGYEITVHELTFSDGTSFDEFVMTG